MGRVHLSGGGGLIAGTDYTRKFPANRAGTCPLCERGYIAGDLMKWEHKQVRPYTWKWLPAHVDCNAWKYKARNNPQTRDGGYDVPPSTPTRADRKLITSTNRRIDRTAQFG